VAIIVPLLLGVIIGFSSGMFGIGGALLATPLLKLFLSVSEYVALATPLPAAIPAAISGSIAYSREKLIRYDVAWRVLIAAIPMTFAGAWLTKYTSGPVLMIITGLLLAYSSAIFIQRGFRRNPPADRATVLAEGESPVKPMMYVAGAFAGFLSGFLAIGGGMILVPAFVKIVGMPTKPALATSLLCVAALAVPGVVTHSYLGHIDWMLALLLCATVIPMSYLGARVATKMRSATLEKIYGIVMFAFAIFFTIKNLYH
jgi:uncharacterized membrane protein YfcA